MAFHIRDQQTDAVIRKLARLKGMSLTETVREAATKELTALTQKNAERDIRPLRERIKPIQDRLASRGWSGLEADKAFYDSLSSEK
jgi:antitoxin VapB